MNALLEDLLSRDPFSLPQAEKERALLSLFQDLCRHHQNGCAAFRHIYDAAFSGFPSSLENLPYLPIDLFKQKKLQSVDDEHLRVGIASSGTTGTRSRIAMDATDARLTARALAVILKQVTSGRRMPLLVIDTEAVLRGGDETMGARAAAILGLMPFGIAPCFVLRDDLSLDEEKLKTFLNKHRGKEILVYGFTFLLWQKFLPFCEKERPDLSSATLLHSGGWKRLQDIAVSPQAFNRKFKEAANVSLVRNFYGMAELPGVIFLEQADGLLYPPCFADVIVRDPLTFEPLPVGHEGLIQVLSPLPRSFPGFSLLTEDWGRIEIVDSACACGKGFRLLGRVAKATPRGCSDVMPLTPTGAA